MEASRISFPQSHLELTKIAVSNLVDTAGITIVTCLRGYLEGGRKDSNGGGKQHPAMAGALKAKGYVYQWLETTDGTHGGLNGNTTFPEGLIGLWKGWKYR